MKKIVLLFSLLLTFITSAQETYYSDVDLDAEGLTLKDELATKTIAAHTKILSYGWPALQATDVNPENSSEVLLIYGYSASGTTARTSGVNSICSSSCPDGSWNREHVYPKSLGTPNLGQVGPGADAHHLRPSDVGFNSDRGSLKFVDGSGNAGPISGGWYPGDEWKGDVARIMMYMYIRYGDQCKPTGVGTGNSSATPDDMIDLFLEWNVEDPVSDFERQRNTYHENTSNAYAQGNRNPFIDNAYLATRIWGGDNAIDSWGLYLTADSEAPTTPTNVSLSNITTTTIDASWNASSDNVAVTKYEIYVDGSLQGNTANTNYTISGLNSNTSYAVTILAKDIANNKSTQSSAVNGTTLTDTEVPTVPTNITITKLTGTGFNVNWNAATDNAAVIGYDIYINGTFNASTANTSYSVSGLMNSTTYSVTVLAKDEADNKSAQSTAVTATTTDGSISAVELFFSEYVEGSGFNKAIEIANITENTADLSSYSIARQSGGQWETALYLTGSIPPNDVYVIINSDATDATLIAEADLGISNVTPMTFNGDDRVGLFKDAVLVDIIGDLNGTNDFGKNITLRRNNDITAPNTVYSEQGEWTSFGQNTVDDIGFHNVATASVTDNLFSKIKMYPNPVTGNKIYFNVSNDVTVEVYNVLGKIVMSTEVTATKNNFDVSNLSKGIYILKINSGKQFITKKLIKN
jgi:endonuclease I/chitodextrinase